MVRKMNPDEIIRQSGIKIDGELLFTVLKNACESSCLKEIK